MKKFDVIVIGGGASGLMAAGRAGELGKNVLLVEKMKRPGRKLAITGKGRCNITTTVSKEEFIEQVHPNGRFLQSAFSKFYSNDLIKLLNDNGLATIKERGNRVFPKSGRAFDVVDTLVNYCIRNRVKIQNNTKALNIITENNEVKGIEVALESNKKVTYLSKKIILSTGGLSYPLTGSTGDGYEIAKKLGHTISATKPMLVPLEIEGDYHSKLKGLELKNIKATLRINNKIVSEEFGEMTFYEHGISGPIILTLSRIIIPELIAGKEIELSLDLKSALSHEKLNNRLIRDFENFGKDTLRTILNKLLPKLLIPICLRDNKLSANKPGNQMSAEERKKLVNWLKDFRLKVINYRDYDEAIITSGGIPTKEIEQKSMESKIVKGLYFSGEIIDLDGPTGGYNLQIAFSTGWIAGESAAY